MISLVERSCVPVAADRVWRWFLHMEEHYRDWHPEHIEWRTLRGAPLAEGTILFADERVGPLRLAARFHIHDVRPGRYFAFRLGFPFSLVRAGGWFRFTPLPDGRCEVTAETHLGFSAPILGPVIDRLLAAALPLDELRRHMREEGENMIRLLDPARSQQAPVVLPVQKS